MQNPAAKLRVEFRIARRLAFPSLKGMEVLASLLPHGAVSGCQPDILESSPDSNESFYAILMRPAASEAQQAIGRQLGADPELTEVRVLPADDEDEPERPTREVAVRSERLHELERQASEMIAAFGRMSGTLRRLRPGKDFDGPEDRDGLEGLRAAHQTGMALAQQMRDTARGLLVVPASVLLSRLRRPVRDLARELGKQVQFTVLGGDTELEQSVLDELREPMVHLVRNAAGHGIEMPEDRLRAGKTLPGTIAVGTYIAGDNFVIDIRDDGRGLDTTRISKRAMQMGLVTPEELEAMTDAEILNFIYLPGFSTADSVSTLSGRGIGMDVVKARVIKLHGTIETVSLPGQGTTFTLRVPLAASLIRALVVEAGGRRLALPSSAIRSVGYASDFVGAKARGVPIFSLAGALGWGSPPAPLVVEVGVAEKRIALGVEACLAHEELAIRPLGRYLGHVPAITGAAILQNGQPVLVLDAAELADQLGV
ncbi:MAG: chemotaxis protein CheW [Candidatus Wallbacteria bacterium]|nr:chemotaxis protein CheW [Candidatus Wallbacteria bacterium]